MAGGGVFFVSIAVFQLIWAFAALGRATTEVLVAGVLLNVGAVALWLVSRTAGAPFGPHAGMPERVQAADLCALLLQIYVVMGAGWVLYRGHFGQQIPALANALILLGAVGVVTLASTVGVASGLRHGHHTPAGAEVPIRARNTPRPTAITDPSRRPLPVGYRTARDHPQAPAPVDTPPAHDEHGEHAH